MPKITSPILTRLWSEHRLPNWSPAPLVTEKVRESLREFNDHFGDRADLALASALRRFAKEKFYRNTDTSLPLLCSGGKLIPYAEADVNDKDRFIDMVLSTVERGDDVAAAIRPYQAGGAGSPVELAGTRYAVVLGRAGVNLLSEGDTAYADYDEVRIARLTDEAVLAYYTFDENKFSFPVNMLGLRVKELN